MNFNALNIFRLGAFLPGPVLGVLIFFYKSIAATLFDGIEPKWVLFLLAGGILGWLVLGAIALWLSAHVDLFFAYRFLEIRNLIGQAPKQTTVFGFLSDMNDRMRDSYQKTAEVHKYMGPYIDGAVEASFLTLKPGENVTLMKDWRANTETLRKSNPLGKAV